MFPTYFLNIYFKGSLNYNTWNNYTVLWSKFVDEKIVSFVCWVLVGCIINRSLY